MKCEVPEVTNFEIAKFEKDKNYAVTASAGTGKTYTIVEIVNKLVDLGVPLDKMVIVTYTEKAAGELRDRIRKKVGDRYNVDTASIGTIHSFCQRTIDEFFISTGKPSKQQLIDESDAESFIKRYIREGDIQKDICEIKKADPGVNLEKGLVTAATALLKEYYLNQQYEEDESVVVYNPLEEKVSKGEDLRKVFPELETALNTLGKSTNSLVQAFYNCIVELLEKNSVDFKNKRTSKTWTQNEIDAFESIKSIRDKLKSIKSTANERVLVFQYKKDIYRKWQLEKAKRNEQTYGDMLRTVREEIVNERPLLNKLQDKYQYAIIDEFQDTNRIQWDIFKKVFLCTAGHNLTVVGDPKQSIYAFQGADLSVFNEAVKDIENQGGEVCELQKNWRSTEEMVESLNVFFEDSPALSGPNSFSPSECADKGLDVKYEGNDTKAIWIGQKDSPEQPDDTILDEEEYAKIVCQTIVDCCTKDSGGNSKLRITVKLKDDNGKEHQITRNVNFSDFAILARTRPEMVAVSRALEKSGIPYLRYKDNSVFSGTECSHWIALLEAIDTPDYTSKNRIRFKNALFTKFFGYSLEKLRDPEYDKDNNKEIKQFNHWKVLAKADKWEEMIDDIIYNTKLENNLGALNELKSFGTFKQLGEYCIEYLSDKNSLSKLISKLKKLRDDKDDDYEGENDNIVAKSTDFPSVRLMTVHASKGLEFPVVISVSGFKNLKTGADIYSYRLDGKKVLSFIKDDAWTAEMAQEWQRLYYVAYTRAKYILMLPQYKELTRGFEFIARSVVQYKERGDYRQVTDSGKSFKELKEAVSEILNNTATATAEETTEEGRKEELKALAGQKALYSTRKYSYSNLTHKRGGTKEETLDAKGHVIKTDVIDDDDEATEDTVPTENKTVSQSNAADYDKKAKVIPCEYDTGAGPIALSQTFPAGADLGNALHDIFELIAYTKDYTDKENAEELDGITRRCFEEYGFNVRDEWCGDVREIVRNVLGSKLPGIKGETETGDTIQLKEIAFENRKNEAEFNYNKGNERLKDYFNGFIDLIFRQGEYYSVLDWKSDRLNDDDLLSYNNADNIKTRVDNHYSIQRVLYAYTLIKWLKNAYKGLGEEEIFGRHFGGIYYVFLRGCNDGTGNGVYAQTWEKYEDLKEAYDKIVSERITKEADA